MKIIFLLFAFCVYGESLWLKGNERSLFSDRKAMRVGDIITVVILESAKADDMSLSKRDKSIELEASGGGALDFIPKLTGEAGSKYKRGGARSKRGYIQAKVSASVIKVMPNGNLLIEGEKRVRIDEEEQVVYVSGIARPDDITPDNAILSTYLADSKIEYKSDVKFSSKEKPNIAIRVFQRLFGWIF